MSYEIVDLATVVVVPADLGKRHRVTLGYEDAAHFRTKRTVLRTKPWNGPKAVGRPSGTRRVPASLVVNGD